MVLSIDIFNYLIMPTFLFIGILLIWFVQSVSLLFLARRFIFPVLYKNKLTEWLIIEFAIAIHELSHLLAAFFTGSEIDLKESFVSSKSGRIAARTSSSIGGWISVIIAAFAPAFIPSLILFIASIALFQISIPFHKVLDTKPDMGIDVYLDILVSVLSPLVDFLLSLIFSPTLLSLLFIYFIMVFSLTSTPSEDDWNASASVLLSFPVLPLFIVFLLLNYVSIQFNFNLFLFVLVLLSIVLLYISFGILFNFIFIFLIVILSKIADKLLIFARNFLKINY